MPTLLLIEDEETLAKNVQRYLARQGWDVELAGTMVRAGDKVVVYHVSAHYDEREFRDPLGFDVARAPNRTSPSAAARTSAWAQDCATLPGHTAAGVRSGRAQAGNRKRGSDLDRDRARVSVADLRLDHPCVKVALRRRLVRTARELGLADRGG